MTLIASGTEVELALKVQKKLKENNINVLKDHQGVGRNLTDHLMLRPVYKIKNLETLNDIYYSFTKKMFSF